MKLDFKYTLWAKLQLSMIKFIAIFNHDRAAKHLEWLTEDMDNNLKKYFKVTTKPLEEE